LPHEKFEAAFFDTRPFARYDDRVDENLFQKQRIVEKIDAK